MIDSRTLKGFRDYPPLLMIPRERMMETARGVDRSFGFAPIDTPAMVLAEIRLPKIGPAGVLAEMAEKGAGANEAGRILDLAGTPRDSTEILDLLAREFGGNAKVAAGVPKLRELLDVCRSAGVPDGRVHIDLAIA